MLNRCVKVLICILISNSCFSQEKNNKPYIDSKYHKEKHTNHFLIEEEKKLLQYDTLVFAKDLGDAYHNLGKLYNSNKNYEKAIDVTTKAIGFKRSIKDTFEVNKSLNNIYYFYTKLDKDSYENRLAVLHQIIENKAYDKYTLQAYIKAAKIYTNKGDYHSALKHLDSVIKTYPVNHTNTELLVKAHIESIKVYSELKIKPDQVHFIEFHNSNIEEHASISFQEDLAANNNNLGNIYEDLELDEKAILHYNKALEYYLETEDHEQAGKLYNNLGNIYSKLKNTKKAATYFNKAEKITDTPDVLANVSHNRGFYLETNDPIEKIPYYQKSLKYLLDNKYQHTSLETLPSITAIKKSNYEIEILEDLIQIANTWMLSYKEDEDTSKLLYAKETLFLIDKLISHIRLESSVDQSKLFWIDKGVDTYMLGVEICYLLKDTEKAFYFMEKNKSLVMLENLSDVSKQNLAITTLESVKNNYVTKTSNFIEYILNEKEGYGIFNSTTETAFFKIENVPALIEQVATLKKQCSIRFSKKEHGIAYTKNAHTIFQKLFPFEEALQKIAGKKLTIVSDYTIKNIPFEALTINDKADAIKESFLINQTEISYLHSASVSNQLQQKERKSNAMVLGVAPAIFKMDSLVALDNSIEDIKQIASFFPTKILKKEEATKTNVVAVMNDYKVIHLNTHAGLDQLTREPWIALYDEKITLKELYHQPIQADLVVLDACKSASGKLAMGEGIMSLSRGFTYNGAASVIASQWNANEKASSDIFQTFYKELHSGSSKSKALHRAKLTYLNNNQLSEISPYYWATMMLTGNAEPIKIQQTSYKWVVFLFIGIGILGLIYFLYTKK